MGRQKEQGIGLYLEDDDDDKLNINIKKIQFQVLQTLSLILQQIMCTDCKFGSEGSVRHLQDLIMLTEVMRFIVIEFYILQ